MGNNRILIWVLLIIGVMLVHSMGYITIPGLPSLGGNISVTQAQLSAYKPSVDANQDGILDEDQVEGICLDGATMTIPTYTFPNITELTSVDEYIFDTDDLLEMDLG